jgi:hypothetical protein
LLLGIKSNPTLFFCTNRAIILVSLLLLLFNSLTVGGGIFLGAFVSELVIPRNLVQVLQLAQFLEDGTADRPLAGGESDMCERRPVVFAEFGRFCLLAVEGKLLEIMEALQTMCQPASLSQYLNIDLNQHQASC